MNLLTPTLIAVGFCALPLFMAWYYDRRLQVERFRFKCNTLFNQTVIYNEKLPDPLKVQLIEAYQRSSKSRARMIFSFKPMEMAAWYGKLERRAFFNLQNQTS